MVKGNGKVITKTVDVANHDFDTLNHSLNSLVELKVNPELKGKEFFSIEGEENILDMIKINVGTALDLSVEGSYQTTKPMKIVFHTSSLKRIRCSGTGAVEGVYFADSLKLNLSGTGSVTLSGIVNNLVAQISGTGSAELTQLQSQDALIDISGTGNANICAKKSADVSVSGISKVNVYGGPAEFSQNISGLGTIKKIDNKLKP
jgi:hypothetical protein